MKTAVIVKILDTKNDAYKQLIFAPVRSEDGVLTFPESKPILAEFIGSLNIVVGDVVAL